MHRQPGKIPIGISSCLLGEKVRYDGGHKKDAYITATLAEYFQFVPFCPELACGLGVPRPPLQLQQTELGIHCIGVRDADLDVTAALRDCAEQQSHWLSGLCGYILKKNSPSCGMQNVNIFHAGKIARTGAGLFAGFLQERFPLLPLEEEDRLGNPRLCENFLQRVQVLQRWRQMPAGLLTVQRLRDFHIRHHLLIMSRDQELASTLQRLVAGTEQDGIRKVADTYILRLLDGLKQTATQDDHVAVLRYSLKLLKQALKPDDNTALQAAIENYQNRKTALARPVELLKKHLPRSPDPVLQQSCYLHPEPAIQALYQRI